MKPAAPAAVATPATANLINDPYAWMEKQSGVTTSAEIQVPVRLIDQVIGQELAVAVAAKAASQKRHLLLIGEPGTGKSMIAKAMAEMLPVEKLNDILAYHNSKDPNQPKILTVDAGNGPKVVRRMKIRARRQKFINRALEWVVMLGVLGLALYFFLRDLDINALFFGFLVVAFFFMIFKQRKDPVLFAVPKLMLSHDPSKETHAPYVDGTGAHAGALLGDVRHDPFQSGGLETPTHERVEVGAIHRSHKGILFIDEINVLRLDSQQSLLTALQDRVYPIVGQSQTSSGAMVRTEPVPCDFILVAAGNLDAIQPPDGQYTGMHPALRSRIRGYGYEVYVNSRMDDNHENRMKLCRFVAQEVVRDGRIPHFERDAIAEVILEAQRRSGQRGKLTLRLRELGGLVRTAGDIAAGENRAAVTAEDVRNAKRLSRSLEQQVADSELETRRTHDALKPHGELMGLANGGGLVGTGEVGEPAGLVVPVAAAITSPLSRSGGHIAFGGGLEESARAQTELVAAFLKTLAGEKISNFDIHLQSLVPQEGVDAEGVGAALAVCGVSALERIPIRQDHLILGAITVGGEVRAVRGVTQKIEAAVDAGFTHALVPASNQSDVLLSAAYRPRIKITFVNDVFEILENVVASTNKKDVIHRLRVASIALLGTRNGHTKAASRRR